MSIFNWWKNKTYIKCEVAFCDLASVGRYRVCNVDRMIMTVYLCKKHYIKAIKNDSTKALDLAAILLLTLEDGNEEM